MPVGGVCTTCCYCCCCPCCSMTNWCIWWILCTYCYLSRGWWGNDLYSGYQNWTKKSGLLFVPNHKRCNYKVSIPQPQPHNTFKQHHLLTHLTPTTYSRRSLSLTANCPIITREDSSRSIKWSKQYTGNPMTQYAFDVTNDENSVYTMTSDFANTYILQINSYDGAVSITHKHEDSVTEVALSSLTIHEGVGVYYTTKSTLLV